MAAAVFSWTSRMARLAVLGLVLAVPCLLAFGYFRAKIDTICTDAIARTARIVGHIPAGADCPEALEPGKDASP